MIPDLNPLGSAAVKRIPWRYKSTVRTVLTSDSLAYYFRRLLDVGDFVATVYGPKNAGKSESTIELCRQICPEFNIDEDVVFTLEDFYDVMENGKPKRWRVKVLDDFGSELDPSEGMFDPARHTSHYLQTSRTFHTGYFITTPNRKFINKDTRDRIADYFIELKSKNVQGKYVTAVVQWVQYNNRLDKNYNHSLCLGPNGLINNKGWGTKIWNWIFYPPPEEVSDEYKPLRDLKGQRNLDSGIADFKKAGTLKKPIEQIVKEIMEQKSRYSRITKKGKPVLIRGLIAYDFNLKSNTLPKVMALAKNELDKTI